MAHLAVVGGGIAGLAAAARLSKLGHSVTLIEADDRLGGSLGLQTADTPEGRFTWDRGPAATLVPAALRDLFRKSGRPLERELDLVPVEVTHHLPDGSRVSLPGGSRAGQLTAIDALGSGMGERWCAYAASFSEDWELLRRHVFERAFDAAVAPRSVTRLLRDTRTLAARAAELEDPRLITLATADARLGGHRPETAPAWLGVSTYLEQRLGRWTAPDGLGALAEVLATRLADRGVEVMLSHKVLSLTPAHGGWLLTTPTAELSADGVIWAAPAPPPLPAARPSGLRRLLPAPSRHPEPADPRAHPRLVHPRLVHPRLVHLALSREWTEGSLSVWHPADPLEAPLEVRHTGSAPAGHAAVSLLSWSAADPVSELAARGLDLGPHIVSRLDNHPDPSAWGRSLPHPRMELTELGPRSASAPMGLLRAGAGLLPGMGLPGAVLSAAQIADLVGRA